MIKKNALEQFIVTIVIILLFTFNSGTAQSDNRDINSYAYINVVNMVVDAFNDSSISIALCKVPVTRQYPASIYESEDKRRKHNRITTDMMSCQIQVIIILRGINDIDSLFYLSKTFAIREGSRAYLPSVSLPKDSEWILFLNSPFLMSNPFDVSLMEKYEKMDLQEFLNPRNFFSLYELGAGGLCTYCPVNAKYPPQFTYSEGLVDDFRTIIMLQENPSLLSESDNSYETYYSSMKDDLGKRVFSRLFGNANNVVNMVVDALNDSNISIALCKVPDSSRYTASESEVTVEKFNRILRGLASKQIQVIEKLRGDGDIDSLFFLNWIDVVRPNGTYRDGSKSYRPFFFPWDGSEWIMLLDSPFLNRPNYNVSLMERYELIKGKSFLNSNNFFTLYEMDAGALPIHMPKKNNYPKTYLYSKELIDDFKTIIELQENPSLLSESNDSYENYYKSMKEELGKRVFSQLFESPDQE